MSYEFKSNEPIFSQIERLLKQKIIAGTYPAGEKIPSIREMAIELNVTPNTVQHALQSLEQEGLIYTARTNGKYVTENLELISEIRAKVLHESISNLITDLLMHNYTIQDIYQAIRKELDEDENK